MTTQRQVLIKPALLQDITVLPAKEALQVMAKITLLTQDPLPDGHMKKHLTHVAGKPYRLRSGDYRIFYTFDKHTINILTIRKRKEDTYAKGVEGMEDDIFEETDLVLDDAAPAKAAQPNWEQIFAQPTPPAGRALPEPITVELLNQLRVSKAYHKRLLLINNQEDLLACPGVDDEVLLRIDEYMFDRPLQQVMQQPDLVLAEVDDLLRYKEGELLGFLLHLSPEQEKYVHWSLNATGPTLVKGGPGTGKSTVALYRVRSLLSQLQKAGQSTPRLLFTTYTNALIKSSEQLLQQLLGADAQYVRVDTADKLAYAIIRECGQAKDIIESEDLSRITRQAISETPLEGNLLQQQAQQQILERLGTDYLRQEFTTVIIARQLRTLTDYLETSRSGRKLRLHAHQRTLVWRIYEHWCALLKDIGKETWQQRRARAEELVATSSFFQAYDAVVIDEAQDLDPSVLRMLVKLCKGSNRLFVTADANQSIYGSGFSWSDVHQQLKFQGRTSILKANYRSTQEIGEAAHTYLTSGVLDSEEIERLYINNGPIPDVRAVLNSDHEAQLLASFFKKASVHFRLTLGSCAVLCPGERVGKAIAHALNILGLEATYMTGHDLDLTRSGIKILTLSSSKGLEFPIVALAGFVGSSYPMLSAKASHEEQAEQLARERRTLFVGMTRTMRTLLIIIPADTSTSLLQGFDPTYWNTSRTI